MNKAKVHVKKDFPPWQIVEAGELQNLQAPNKNQPQKLILTITNNEERPDFLQGEELEVQYWQGEEDNFFCKVENVQPFSGYTELTVIPLVKGF